MKEPSTLLRHVPRSDAPHLYRLCDEDLLRLVLREGNNYVPRVELAIALQDALVREAELREAIGRHLGAIDGYDGTLMAHGPCLVCEMDV